MKFKLTKISLADLIHRYKFISLITNSIFNLFFSVIRLVCRLLANDSGNVVVISLHRLGDTVFTIPAIREIQKHYGNKITIVCYPEAIPIYKLAFENIIFCEFDRKDFYFTDRIAKFKLKRRLKSLKPGIIIDLVGSLSSALLLFNLRAKKIIGINKIHFKAIYDHFTTLRETPQLIDIYLDVISTVVKIPDRAELKKVPESVNTNARILIHPFAGWKEKEWNFKNYISLAEKIDKNFKVSIIAPLNYLSTDVVQELEFNKIDVIQTNSSNQLIQEIIDCSFFIGNDSGPVNIANFLGKPTFTIYSATNPDYTSLDTKHQQYTQRVLYCSAKKNEKYCIIGGGLFQCPGIQCMNSQSVDAVYDKVIPLVRQYCS